MNSATSTLLYWFFKSDSFPNFMSIFTSIKNHISIYSNVLIILVSSLVVQSILMVANNENPSGSQGKFTLFNFLGY